jgi:hypothetical protein
MCQLSQNLGACTSWNPTGLLEACTGIALPFTGKGMWYNKISLSGRPFGCLQNGMFPYKYQILKLKITNQNWKEKFLKDILSWWYVYIIVMQQTFHVFWGRYYSGKKVCLHRTQTRWSLLFLSSKRMRLFLFMNFVVLYVIFSIYVYKYEYLIIVLVKPIHVVLSYHQIIVQEWIFSVVLSFHVLNIILEVAHTSRIPNFHL